MKIRLSNEQVQALANALVEFQRPLEETVFLTLNLKDGEQIDDTSEQTLDTLVFQCSVCSVWHKIEDLRGNTICEDCYLEYDPEEEYGYYSDDILCLGPDMGGEG